jgi:hypothetical protein
MPMIHIPLKLSISNIQSFDKLKMVSKPVLSGVERVEPLSISGVPKIVQKSDNFLDILLSIRLKYIIFKEEW